MSFITLPAGTTPYQWPALPALRFPQIHGCTCQASFSWYCVRAWYDQATTKNSRQIIKEHESFFDGLSDIDTVIVIGHSLSEVDMEYFEKICSEIHSDAKWIFSCHDSAGLKAISALVKTMAIGADRVTIFRL